MQNKMSSFNYSLRFDIFNYSLRFGQGGLDIDVPLRIAALHFITCYGLIKIRF